MKAAVILCVAILVTLVVAEKSTNFQDQVSPRVVGGVSARRTEFPHLCAIELIRTIGTSTIVGAGNVLSRRWILTVATNIYANSLFQRSEVICGRFDLSVFSEPTEQRLRIVESIRHPQFVASGVNSAFDIALIQLASELHFTPNVQPINLPVAAAEPSGIASLVGWGGSDEAIFLQRLGFLQMTRVAILPAATCNLYLAAFNMSTPTSHFCTGPTTGGHSPCDDDHGSALLQVVAGAPVAVGLVSLPQACGSPGHVGTYTRVSAFIPWINGYIF